MTSNGRIVLLAMLVSLLLSITAWVGITVGAAVAWRWFT